MKIPSRESLWPVLIAGTLFVVSGRSEVAAPSGWIPSVDKIAHFAVFGALATSLVRVPALRRRGKRGQLLAWVLACVYGGLDEWRQSFTPGRFMEFDDWLADCLGAAVAVWLWAGSPAWRRLLETPVFQRANSRPS